MRSIAFPREAMLKLAARLLAILLVAGWLQSAGYQTSWAGADHDVTVAAKVRPWTSAASRPMVSATLQARAHHWPVGKATGSADAAALDAGATLGHQFGHAQFALVSVAASGWLTPAANARAPPHRSV